MASGSECVSEDGEFARCRRVDKLFQIQAACRPGAIALQAEENCWSYSKLDRSSNYLASQIRKHSVEPSSFVAVCVRRSPEAIAAFLGILKAGAAYLPLDLNYPAERLRYMLDDAGVRCILADRAGMLALTGISSSECRVLELKDLQGESESGPAIFTGERDLAYLMYTSGSTGAPKGAMIEHRGIVNLVRNQNYVDLSPNHVLLQLSPLSFDASTFEIWGALLNGGRLAIMPPEQPSLAGIAAALNRYRVTTLFLSTGLFNAMADEYSDAFRDLDQLVVGGDVLSPSHARKALDAMPRGTLINGYGPTENTTFTCCHRVTREDTAAESIPIGRPLNGVKLHLLDRNMRPVADGEAGEIFIGGENLSRGYWNRPELTREKFVPNPFSEDTAERLYRSGDLGQFNKGGTIDFLGRLDGQVKIRGFRIEPGEVESAIQGFAGIACAAVVMKGTEADRKRLCCYFVPSPGTAIAASRLAAFLRERLPAYMIPAEFIELRALPLNANGKVDRQALALRLSETREPAVSTPDRHPGLKNELMSMWEELLGKSNIGLDDDFFQLGGHSLLAARLFAQIQKRLAKQLPLASIIQASTIRKLAAVIRDNNWVAPWSSLVQLSDGGPNLPLFLIHPIGGNILTYKQLAVRLTGQPVYGLQAQGLDGRSPAASSVESMAAHYIRAMRTVQPEGPYSLGGFSAGGTVAFEMARQLQNSGCEVGFLAIVDSSFEPPVWTLLKNKDVAESYERIVRVLRWNAGYMNRIGARQFARKKVRNFGMSARIAGYVALNALANLVHGTSPRWALSVEEAFLHALGKYTAAPFAGDATLLLTFDSGNYNPELVAGWMKLVTGKLDVCRIAARHDDLLNPPQVDDVARQLSESLSRARAKASLPAQAIAALAAAAGGRNLRKPAGSLASIGESSASQSEVVSSS
jgi:amino acid adenylation domain-containing protein